jgi:hypothetical protein
MVIATQRKKRGYERGILFKKRLIAFRVTEVEFKEITKRAAESGKGSKSEWVRSLFLSQLKSNGVDKK